MIRNAVIHLSNEQPLVADLFALPTAGDVGLLCTNVRTPDGKRPVFVDRSEATFFFPYLHIRFIEMPSIADDGTGGPPASARRGPASEPLTGPDTPGAVPDIDRGSLLPVPIALGDGSGRDGDGPDDMDIEIDEDFLRKIRDL